MASSEHFLLLLRWNLWEGMELAVRLLGLKVETRKSASVDALIECSKGLRPHSGGRRCSLVCPILEQQRANFAGSETLAQL